MAYIEDNLTKFTQKLRAEIACECFFQFSEVDKYKNNIPLQLHLPKLLEDMNLTVRDVIYKNIYFCTIAVEVDENKFSINKTNNTALTVHEIEKILQEIVGTTVKSFGIISDNKKEYRTFKFIMKDNEEKTYNKEIIDIVDKSIPEWFDPKMKVFKHEEFNNLLMKNDSIIKLPEYGNGYFFMVIINASEVETGIGNDYQPFQQNWELIEEIGLNNTLYFVFKMWGRLPANLKIDKDVSHFEGKKFAVPANTIIGLLNNLSSQDPHRFNINNLRKTQAIGKHIKLEKT